MLNVQVFSIFYYPVAIFTTFNYLFYYLWNYNTNSTLLPSRHHVYAFLPEHWYEIYQLTDFSKRYKINQEHGNIVI